MNEVYDPTQNPRHLATVRDEPTPVDAQVWADLHTDLSTINAIGQTVSTEGWRHLEERIAKQLSRAKNVTHTADNRLEVFRAQGAIRACEWLLDLPAQVARERQRLVGAIESSRLVDE